MTWTVVSPLTTSQCKSSSPGRASCTVFLGVLWELKPKSTQLPHGVPGSQPLLLAFGSKCCLCRAPLSFCLTRHWGFSASRVHTDALWTPPSFPPTGHCHQSWAWLHLLAISTPASLCFSLHWELPA